MFKSYQRGLSLIFTIMLVFALTVFILAAQNLQMKTRAQVKSPFPRLLLLEILKKILMRVLLS